MKELFLLIVIYLAIHGSVIAQQKEVAWDNTTNKNWSNEFKLVKIKSSADSSLQNAWYYQSGTSTSQPLIVSLHTWSGDYNQKDPLAKEILLAEARKRSPIFLKYQPDLRKGAFLNIYAGIHDGYTGSVPITHSINIFNKLLLEMYPDQANILVNDSIKLSLLSKQINPDPDTLLELGGRKIHLIRKVPGLCLTIFEGGHEMIVPQALSLIPLSGKSSLQKLNILTIGDSNGAIDHGWPNQLKKCFPFSTIINKSISGNTIGFDNLGQPKLNTLKNIDLYLEEAYNEIGKENDFDVILIGLGTNDTKKVFENRQKEVAKNMSLLVQKIQQFVTVRNKIKPAICIITPSPMDEQKVNQEKYGGGDERIQKNNQQFRKVAMKNQVDFLDTYTTLKKGFPGKTEDGVHLNEKAQFEMAGEIVNYLNRKQP